ncbi:MAG: Ltp family lipoprotein [Christensenellales bacterium]|jgi:hypothetical protein
MHKEKMTNCAKCGAEISESSDTCPYCGAKKKQPYSIFKKWWFWVVAAVLVIAIITGINDNNPGSLPDYDPVKSFVPESTAGENGGQEPAAAGTPSVETPAPTETGAQDDVPSDYRNALIKAKSYSDVLHMSRQAIYDQLVSEFGEKFPAKAAQYAIDHLDADYKANALEKAKDYSETLHMSKQGIYDQLISEYGEKFTPEEAQYAIDNLTADYKANALEKAKTYQSSLNMSKQAIYDQLISEYGEQFTAEEAQYAIDNLE